jgi:peroxiredoxin
MKNRRLALCFLLGAVTAATSALATAAEPSTPLARSAADDTPKKLEIGSTVPADLSLKDFEGRKTTFGDLRGKIVLLHFWSDRCPAERHADPIFKQMDDRYADSKDVVMIGIAANQNELGAEPGPDDDWSKFYTNLREKRDKVGYRHTILADHGNRVSAMFQARSTPHCFVIDRKGVIRYAGALDDDPRGSKGDEATNYLVDAATAILAGKQPAVTETKPYG